MQIDIDGQRIYATSTYQTSAGTIVPQGNANARAPNAKSIAVLAFEDMSPDRDHEYFSDGMSEEILNLLARIPDLVVIGRTSSFSFKGLHLTNRVDTTCNRCIITLIRQPRLRLSLNEEYIRSYG